MKDEKRKSKSYKTTETLYKKAMRRAKAEKRNLANIVEHCVGMYAEGFPSVVFGAMPSPKQPKPPTK